MKSIYCTILFITCINGAFAAQVVEQRVVSPVDLPPGPASGNSSTYSVLNRTAHSRTWAAVTWRTNALGRIRAITNSYVELETGLHHRGANGTWLDSNDQIQVQPEGGALATNGQHQVYFPGDLYSDAFRLTTPDSMTLVSRPLGLAFSDGNQSVLIAELKPGSVGQLLSSGSQVLYTNICTDIRLDLLASYKLGGFESDLIIREQLPNPTEYGLSNRVTLQWWTEFLQAPQPDKEERVTSSGLTDEFLHFGSMKMGPGRAFLIGEEQTSLGQIPVAKHWLVISNRTFLVEEIPLSVVVPKLESLPVRTASLNAKPSTRKQLRASAGSVPTQKRSLTHSTNHIELAQLDTRSEPGFNADYTLLTAQDTNRTFTADTTTLITGAVQLYGTTTIEGGTVIKYSSNPTNYPRVYLYGPLSCKTGPYRLAVMTSSDDNSIGDLITGSSGAPAVGNAFCFDAEGGGAGAGDSWELKYVRMAYCYAGFQAYWNSILTVRDCQFFLCTYPVGVPNTGNIKVRNTIFASCNYPIYGDETAAAENVTAVGYTNFLQSQAGFVSLALTNCILVSTGQLAGSDSATTNLPAAILDHTTLASYPDGLFQTAGGACYYLATGSTNRDAGTTNINSDLLAELKQKTTYPPIVIPSDIITNDMALGPEVQRDGDTPDLGYHYEPLDYGFKIARYTNVTLTLSPGTAIATAGQYGIALWSGSQFVSMGTPTNLNHIARYNLVQENSNTNWNGKGMSFIDNWFGGSVIPKFSARFTDFTMPAQDGDHFNLSYSGENAFLTHCQLHGGKFSVGVPNVNLTNCLFERVQISLGDEAGVLSPIIRNGLFFGGSLTLDHLETSTWFFRDNLFDHAIIASTGDYDMDGAYNAYTTIANHLIPTNVHDILLSSADYQTGPLGNYYYPTNGGNLSTLINAGSTNANLAELYQFTVTTNLISGLQIKETNSVVDIGFHYVAVDSGGNPIDSDSDGLPDYFEDTNGDGIYDAGDLSNWNAADTDGDGINDFIEYVQGRNPRVPNTIADTNGVINLQVYTPLK